jgi:hypothetical protein
VHEIVAMLRIGKPGAGPKPAVFHP